ncbi:FtsX-like permease family protein [Phragmitibacter flavus]|uniref:FtsX-like permease family protein n=1 Tax=Phragmitibacter flavus TaxID=2576071 RepID=A0A5R8KB75_9BACT|nr:ABC transporter permease [Phragmitibacter flavus]TLD69568.1 FtsX-like permease family protein [Phragmitibacter flavus]
MKFLSLVFSNLKRKKLRTVLTVLSIFVAFVLFGTLCIIKEAFTGGISMAGADRLMVMHKMSIIQSLPISYTDRIANLPGVAAITHLSWFGGYYKDPKNFLASFPVNPDTYFAMFPEFTVPPEQMAAWKAKRNGVIVGKGLFDRYAKSDGWKIGSVIPVNSPIWRREGDNETWEFEIVGVYDVTKKGADNTQFLFHYDYFDEGRTLSKGEIGWFSVRVKDPDRAPDIAAAIDKEFANSAYETKAQTEAAAMQGFASQVGDIGTILTAVLSAVFFTILLVAGNTMGQAVRERTEEIGVLKAMGFTNGLVLFLVLAESTVIALIGGLLGLTVAKLIALAGSPVPEMLPIFNFSDRDLITGLILVIVLGIIAGIIPALQAMRLQIAVALRR